MSSNARRNVQAAHLQHVHVSYPRPKGTLEAPTMPTSWRRDGSDGYGRITQAGHRLASWLGKLAPWQRTVLGLQRPEPAQYLPHNRARMAARRGRRRMVQASRRANR